MEFETFDEIMKIARVSKYIRCYSVFFGNDDVILSLYLHFLYVHIITFGEFFIEFFSKSINNCTN